MLTVTLLLVMGGLAAAPSLAYYMGKEVGKEEARRAIFSHPSARARHADKRLSQPA